LLVRFGGGNLPSRSQRKSVDFEIPNILHTSSVLLVIIFPKLIALYPETFLLSKPFEHRPLRRAKWAIIWIMSIRFIQANCTEGKKVDPRQAMVVKRYKPDIIFFELPASKNGPASLFNAYSVKRKPFEKIEQIKEDLRKESRKTPYALSDVLVWDAIAELWAEGHNILLFNIDAAQELRRKAFRQYRSTPLSRAKQQWQFWAYLYVRETIMAHHIERILKRYSKRKTLVVAVFLQSIHWQHVQFLMRHHSKEQIRDYYFRKFPEVTLDVAKEIQNI
jgi:hypothetical protein